MERSSYLLAWLNLKLKPRYHISGLEGIHYERPPFRIPNLTEGDMEIVTRFIALARVGNEKKEKWLYALSLTPLDKMKISELLQKTTDETPCPFDFHELENKSGLLVFCFIYCCYVLFFTVFKNKRKSVSQNQYFYDTNVEEEQQPQKRTKRQKPIFDQSKCWFCLASPSVEKHLVITVGNSVYLALAKGMRNCCNFWFRPMLINLLFRWISR